MKSIKSSDINKLLDAVIVYWKEYNTYNVFDYIKSRHNLSEEVFNGTEYGNMREDYFNKKEIEIFGAIWVRDELKEEPILKSVAKLNENKEWVLI